ncbi:MAG: hypothetical protein Q4D94_04535 [Bacillota bacterium]|nr:hypothetical protein [Bacillota bacterium]
MFMKIRDETLYCPALGIKFSGGEDDIVIPNRVGVFCSDAKYTANSSYEGGYITIYDDNSVLKGNGIEEKLNSYVKNRVDFGDSAIDESVEKNVGNYKFLGKGSSNRYGSETWLFLSDESTYYLQIWYTEKYKLEDYLSVIEELK